MTTDADRQLCRRLADLFYQNHVKNGRGGCDANHIATNISYEETLYRGLLTECAFAKMFNLKMNETVSDYGDDGRDFRLLLNTGKGPREFPVNVKSKSVQVSWEGLRQSGTHLRVPVREIRPQSIYVFGIYYEPTDEADVFRWEWGAILMKENHQAIFVNGNGQPCYIKLFDELRELQELKDRRVP